MAIWYEQAGAISGDSEELVSVQIWSHTALPRSGSAYHRFRVGVARDGNADWVGTFDQSVRSLLAGSVTEVLEDTHRNRRLRAGDQLIVEAKSYNSPDDVSGLMVQFVTRRRPVSVSGMTDDPKVLELLDALQVQINSLEIDKQVYRAQVETQ